MKCIVCNEEVSKLAGGVPVHPRCLGGKSPQVVRLEHMYGHPIEEILVALIRKLDTWDERYEKIGVSKVTIFSWVRKYLGMTPSQAVAAYRISGPPQLQTGLRDYLRVPSAMLIPE